MMVNKLLATGILVPILILIAPNVYASNLSDTQRYNDGYSNGAQAAATDSTYNPTCDPTGAYTSGGGHTAIYCNGWANGYAATWNTKHVVQQAAPTSPVPVTNQSVGQGASPGPNPTCGKAMINGTITAFCAQPANVLLLCADGSTPDATGYCGTQTQSQSFVGTDFGDFSNLAKIPIIGGLIASKSMHTGILHNEQGVFISWSTICNKGQAFILQSCNTLTDSNGNLTPQGDTAIGCIRNGLAATIYAQQQGISIDLTKSILNFAAPLTGCSGIVNLDTIQNEPQFQNLLNIITRSTTP